MKKYGLLAFLSVFYIGAHADPSFDCTKASTSVEKMICADSYLGNLDGLLANNYGALFGSAYGFDEEGNKQLKLAQKEWMKKRNACSTTECVASAYKSRIEEICEVPVVSGVNYCQPWDSLENQKAVSENTSDGINEIISYKESSSLDKRIEPYTVNEIIKIIPDYIYEKGFYKGGISDLKDDKSAEFNKVNFGECEDLYVFGNSYSRGAIIVDSALKFTFPENENSKKNASYTLKNNLEYVEDKDNLKYSNNRCENRNAGLSKIKEIVNEIAKASHEISVAAKSLSNAKQNELLKAQEEEKSRNLKIKEESDRLQIESQRKELEENKLREERQKNENKKTIFYLIIAAVICAVLWHKFIRRRCPKCNAVSPDLIKEVELESWLGTKKVSEKLASGKTKEKIINTTFSKVESTYKCEECNHTWIEHTKREK